MNPVYYGMVPDGQFHSGVPMYPTHAELEVAPVPQPATFYTGQNVLFHQVQQVPVPQQFSFPPAPLHYQHTPGNMSQFSVQHRASPSPPTRIVDRLKLNRHPMPIASPPVPARVVQYSPSVSPYSHSKPCEDISTGPFSDNTMKTKVDEVKTDFRQLALQHGIDVRSPLDTIDTNLQTESNKMNQNTAEKLKVKSYVKQQILKEFDSIYGSDSDIKENQQNDRQNIDTLDHKVLNTDEISKHSHSVKQSEKESSTEFVQCAEIEDELSDEEDEDSFEIEIEDHEILSGHYGSSSWTESESGSNNDDQEEEVVGVIENISRATTDYLDEHQTSQGKESNTKSDQLLVEEMAFAIVKKAVNEALIILSNKPKTQTDGENFYEESIHCTDELQNVSNNCSSDISSGSQTGGKTRLYSWAYTEIHKEDQQKADKTTDVLDQSIPEPDLKAEIQKNVSEIAEEMIQRKPSQETSHCDVAVSNDKNCRTKLDDDIKPFCEKAALLSDIHTHKALDRSCIEESKTDSCQSFDFKTVFKHKDLWRSQSEGSESDMQSLEGSQSDPVEAFKIKASKRGIRIIDPAEKVDCVTDSDADSDLKPDPISRSNTIESFTDYSLSASQQSVNHLNPDVPDFGLDYPSEINLMKLEDVPDTPLVSKNLSLNPDCAIFQPRYEKQDSDSQESQELDDQSFINHELSKPLDTNMRADAPVFVPGGKKDISDSVWEVADTKKPKAGIFYLPTPEPLDEVDLSVAVQASPTVTSVAVGTKRVKLKDSTMCTNSCETREVAINTEGKEEVGHGPIMLPRKPKVVTKSTTTDDVFKRSVGVNVRIKDPVKSIEKKDTATMVDSSCYQPEKDMQELVELVKSLQLDLMKYKEKEVVDQLVQQKDALEKQSEVLVNFFKDSDDLDVIRGLIRNKISTIEKTITMVEVESLRTTLKINSEKTLHVLPDLKKYLLKDEKPSTTDSSLSSAAYTVASPVKVSLSQASPLSSKAGSLAKSPERMVFPIKASPRQISRSLSKDGNLAKSPEKMIFPFNPTPSQMSRPSSEFSQGQTNKLSSEARSLAESPERMALRFKSSPRLSSGTRSLTESPNRNCHISVDDQPFQSSCFELRQTQETITGTTCLSSKLSSPSSTSHTSPLRLPVEPEYISNSPQRKSQPIKEDNDNNFQMSQADKQINRMESKTEDKKELYTDANDSKKDTNIMQKDLISKLMRAEYSHNRMTSNESQSALKSMGCTELDEDRVRKDLAKYDTNRHESVGAEKISHDKITELDIYDPVSDDSEEMGVSTFDPVSDDSEEMGADEDLYSGSLAQTESQNFMEKVSNNRLSKLDLYDDISDDSDEIGAVEADEPKEPQNRVSNLDLYDDISDDSDEIGAVEADELKEPQNLLEKISHNTISELDAYDPISDDSEHYDSLELDESQKIVLKNRDAINGLKQCDLDTDAEKHTLRRVSSNYKNTDVKEDSLHENDNEVKQDLETESTLLPDKQISGQSCCSVDTKEIVMSATGTSQDIQHSDSEVKLKSAASKEITVPVESPKPCPVSTMGHFDPLLFQAVMGQLIHAYPHLASNQTMLTSVAMQQTQLLQMYMKGQQAEDVGQSISPHPNFVSSPVGLSALSSNITLAADIRLLSGVHQVNDLPGNEVTQSYNSVPVMSIDRSTSATATCNNSVSSASYSHTPNSSVKNITMSQDPSKCDKENKDICYTTAKLKSSTSCHIRPPGIDHDLTDGGDLPKFSVNDSVALSDNYGKIQSAEKTTSVYQSEVNRPTVSKLRTPWNDSTRKPLSDVNMKINAFNSSQMEQNKDHKDFFPRFTEKIYEHKTERNVTMTHQDEPVVNRTKTSNIDDVIWRTSNPPELDKHDECLPSKRLGSTVQSGKEGITKSRRSIAANFTWRSPSPLEHIEPIGSFPPKKCGQSIQSEKQDITKKDPQMTDIPPRFRKKSLKENKEQKQVYIPPHLRGQIVKDSTPTLIPSTEDWDMEAENISETLAPKAIPAIKHGMKRKQDPLLEEKVDAIEKNEKAKETNSGGNSEICDIPIPKVPKVDDCKVEAAEEEEEEKEEWCMVTTKKKKSQFKEQPVKQVPPANISTQQQKLSNFERLVYRLQEEFPGSDKKAVIDAVTKVRKQRGSLSGLSVENIIERAQFFIEKKPNKYIPGLHIPQSTSGPKNIMNIPRMKPSPIIKNVPVLSDDEEDICVICHEALSAMETKELECLHTYHYKCISQWVERERTCPTCRQHALFPEEFPRLGK